MKSETKLEMEEMERRIMLRHIRDEIKEATWIHIQQYHLTSIEHRCAYCGADTGHYQQEYCSPYCKKQGEIVKKVK